MVVFREKNPSVPDGTVRDISPEREKNSLKQRIFPAGRGGKLPKAKDFSPLGGKLKRGSVINK
jgi:hypothetical protein